MFTALIADDEVVIREGLRDLFDWEDHGVKVIALASNGDQAYELIQELSPDIIITDIVMPGLSGLDMVAQLRNNGNMAEIILISAYQDVKYFKKAFKINAIDYLLKPVDMAELSNVIDRTVYKLRLARGEVDDIKEEKSQTELDRQNMRKVIRNACVFIDANLGMKLTIAELAQRFYISENYLCQLFRQETGKTINTYITQQRMQRAKDLLVSSPMYINEVAHAVGYQDANYFSRQFKKFFGITPYDFREMV